MTDPLDQLQIRVHGDPARPTLIYLPGIHGDWTLIHAFRKAIQPDVRFVEFSYPRTVTWTLDDYAAAVLDALRGARIERGWLLGESFSSQVAWQILKAAANPAAAGFQPQGLVLAGGFVRYPAPPLLALARFLGRRTPTWALRAGFGPYALYARQRHRRDPDMLAGVREFIRRRLEPADRLAIQHRLALIAENDPRPIASATRLPVYSLVGLVDPIVPAPPVRRWLAQHCPGLRDARTVWRSDHTVLASAAQTAAQQVARWLDRSP